MECNKVHARLSLGKYCKDCKPSNYRKKSNMSSGPGNTPGATNYTYTNSLQSNYPLFGHSGQPRDLIPNILMMLQSSQGDMNNQNRLWPFSLHEMIK